MREGKKLCIAMAGALLIAASGCAQLSTPPTEREQHTAIGALGGGLTGAIIGSLTGSAVAGGLVGMPLGAVAGYYIGDKLAGNQRAQQERDQELERLRRDNERYSRELNLRGGSATASTATDLNIDQVRQVQTRLNQMGYFSGNIDGVWGPETQTALRNFQQSKNLQVTGQLNEQTARALGVENYARAGSTAGSEGQGMAQNQIRESNTPSGQRQQSGAQQQASNTSGVQEPQQSGRQQSTQSSARDNTQTQMVVLTQQDVRQLQRKLNNMGYDAGQVDGIWGPRTQGAVRNFQQAKNLQASGRLNEQTMDALDLR
jgi:peptidoglycan hydrolase-like protein with peptidoglycan-binding domain